LLSKSTFTSILFSKKWLSCSIKIEDHFIFLNTLNLKNAIRWSTLYVEFFYLSLLIQDFWMRFAKNTVTFTITLIITGLQLVNILWYISFYIPWGISDEIKALPQSRYSFNVMLKVTLTLMFKIKFLFHNNVRRYLINILIYNIERLNPRPSK
jgi:hypothetical protein